MEVKIEKKCASCNGSGYDFEDMVGNVIDVMALAK